MTTPTDRRALQDQALNMLAGSITQAVADRNNPEAGRLLGYKLAILHDIYRESYSRERAAGRVKVDTAENSARLSARIRMSVACPISV